MPHLVAGVDSSTQSTKVEIRDVDSGNVVGRAAAPHTATTPPRSEQDPRTWWAAFETALTNAGAAPTDIAAISVGGQQHGLVLLDDGGEPVRPAKLWNDTESARQADGLVSALGAARWAELTGSVPGAAFTITKLAWMAQNEPAALARTAHVMLPHDYLNWRLTGERVSDRGDASGTGWWSASDGILEELLELAAPGMELAAKVPKVLGSTETAGVVSANVRGLLPGTPVGVGTGDNMAAALGLGLRTGDLTISLGTSGTVYAVADEQTHDSAGLVAGFADATGGYLPLVCTLNATKVTEAVRRLMGVNYDELNDLALRAEAGAAGLTLVPYFDGERTPNRPLASGLLEGIRSDVSREELARAAFEGVACGQLDGIDALKDQGVEATGRHFLIGGGSRSVAFQRLFADMLGVPIRVPADDEVVATGACVQAAALASGESFAGIADRWGLGDGEDIEPAGVDYSAVRERYSVMASRRQHGEG